MTIRSGRPARVSSHPRLVQGRVRTAVLSLVTLVALAAIVVIVLVRSLSPPESAPGETGAGPGGPSAPAASGGPSISGTVTLAPALAGKVRDTAVVFVIARRASGPPFAVKRVTPPRFPLAYRIGPEDVMMAGEAFDGEVRVSARVSQTGSAGPPQPGDLEGEHGAAVRIGARNVDVVIARVR